VGAFIGQEEYTGNKEGTYQPNMYNSKLKNLAEYRRKGLRRDGEQVLGGGLTPSLDHRNLRAGRRKGTKERQEGNINGGGKKKSHDYHLGRTA